MHTDLCRGVVACRLRVHVCLHVHEYVLMGMCVHHIPSYISKGYAQTAKPNFKFFVFSKEVWSGAGPRHRFMNLGSNLTSGYGVATSPSLTKGLSEGPIAPSFSVTDLLTLLLISCNDAF